MVFVYRVDFLVFLPKVHWDTARLIACSLLLYVSDLPSWRRCH